MDDLFVAAAFPGHRLRLLAGLAGLLRKSQIVSVSPFRCTDSRGLGQSPCPATCCPRPTRRMAPSLETNPGRHHRRVDMTTRALGVPRAGTIGHRSWVICSL